jgi:hypothetical protein
MAPFIEQPDPAMSPGTAGGNMPEPGLEVDRFNESITRTRLRRQQQSNLAMIITGVLIVLTVVLSICVIFVLRRNVPETTPPSDEPNTSKESAWNAPYGPWPLILSQTGPNHRIKFSWPNNSGGPITQGETHAHGTRISFSIRCRSLLRVDGIIGRRNFET